MTGEIYDKMENYNLIFQPIKFLAELTEKLWLQWTFSSKTV